jgi:DNA-binding protein H-NS
VLPSPKKVGSSKPSGPFVADPVAELKEIGSNPLEYLKRKRAAAEAAREESARKRIQEEEKAAADLEIIDLLLKDASTLARLKAAEQARKRRPQDANDILQRPVPDVTPKQDIRQTWTGQRIPSLSELIRRKEKAEEVLAPRPPKKPEQVGGPLTIDHSRTLTIGDILLRVASIGKAVRASSSSSDDEEESSSSSSDWDV